MDAPCTNSATSPRSPCPTNPGAQEQCRRSPSTRRPNSGTPDEAKKVGIRGTAATEQEAASPSCTNERGARTRSVPRISAPSLRNEVNWVVTPTENRNLPQTNAARQNWESLADEL